MLRKDFLSLLAGVRQTRPGQWLACCPAHDDKSPSLSIKETKEGAILIHCFAQCSAFEVITAVGLEMADLFPDTLRASPGGKPRWSARDLLEVIRREALTVAIGAERIERLTPDEVERVRLAGRRIRTALEVADVR